VELFAVVDPPGSLPEQRVRREMIESACGEAAVTVAFGMPACPWPLSFGASGSHPMRVAGARKSDGGRGNREWKKRHLECGRL